MSTKRKSYRTVLNRVLSDDELAVFLELNEFEKYDREMIRDILIIARLYDRNFNRMKSEDDSMRKSMFFKIENLLNGASIHLRELACIRPRTPSHTWMTKHKRKEKINENNQQDI